MLGNKFLSINLLMLIRFLKLVGRMTNKVGSFSVKEIIIMKKIQGNATWIIITVVLLNRLLKGLFIKGLI